MPSGEAWAELGILQPTGNAQECMKQDRKSQKGRQNTPGLLNCKSKLGTGDHMDPDQFSDRPIPQQEKLNTRALRSYCKLALGKLLHKKVFKCYIYLLCQKGNTTVQFEVSFVSVDQTLQ